MVVAGADILGLKVPQTDPVFLAVLATHVLAALACVVFGAVAALSAKGSVRHIRFGRVYYWSLGLVFATSTTMAAMRWAEDYHLFVIGSIAITAASVGYLHRQLRRPGDAAHITGMGSSYIALLTAFYVDNGENLPLWSHLPHIAYWALPSLIGLPLIARARRSHARAALTARPRPRHQRLNIEAHTRPRGKPHRRPDQLSRVHRGSPSVTRRKVSDWLRLRAAHSKAARSRRRRPCSASPAHPRP
jgi:hypothetical protein